MKTFYFNTGVSLKKETKIYKGQAISSNGVVLIPFQCENISDEAKFMFACDYPDLEESKMPNVIVRKILNSTLVSKYAYFKT
jgi:hypothetical protein